MSKYQRAESTSLPRHKHCKACGTPIDMGKDFCTDKCRLTYGKASRAKTRNFVLITAAVLVFYLLIVFVHI